MTADSYRRRRPAARAASRRWRSPTPTRCCVANGSAQHRAADWAARPDGARTPAARCGASTSRPAAAPAPGRRLAFPSGSWSSGDAHRRLRRAGGTAWSRSPRQRRRAAAAADRPARLSRRLAPAAGGGSWLALFAPRSQLVEFVLREHDYRTRMMARGRAPATGSRRRSPPARSFLEPLQGGGVKTMGMLKPWAPTRSYGLVVRLDAALQPRQLPQPRRRHDATASPASIELGGQVLAASQGGDASSLATRRARGGGRMTAILETRKADQGLSRRAGDQGRRFRRCRPARSTPCSARTAPASRR